MRSDLGRLGAIAEILQVGPVLGRDPDPKGRVGAKWKPVFGTGHAKKINDDSDSAKLDRIPARQRARLASRSARWYIAGKI
jgi:hypothetical protein